MLNNRFYEINGATPPKPAPPPPPKPPTPARNPALSARFLEINGVKPVLNTASGGLGPATSAPPPAQQINPPYKDEEFLRINGVVPRPDTRTPEAAAVDDAVVALETAIDQRNAAPPFARRFLQGDVTEAREDLEAAVRDEIEGVPPGLPYYVDTLDLQRRNASGISDRYHVYYGTGDMPEEVDRAVVNVVVDLEVEDTLERVSNAPSTDAAFDRLAVRFGAVSERAQQRLIAEDEVSEVLDAVTARAMEPLSDIAEADFTKPLVTDALIATFDLTQEADHPDLSAEIVIRIQPALDQAVLDNASRANGGLGPDSLLNYASRTYLGFLSDSMTGSRKAEAANHDLARFVLDATAPHDRAANLVPVKQDGSGVALDVEVIKLADADPDIDAGRLVDRAIDNYERFIDHSVRRGVEDYANHTEELNFYIASFPGTSEQLAAAIEDYVDGAGPEWDAERRALLDEAARLGEQIFASEQLLDDVTHILDRRHDAPTDDVDALSPTEQRLADIASRDVVVQAANLFFSHEMSVATAIDLTDAAEFASGLSLGRKSISLFRKLATASFKRGLTVAFQDFKPGNIDNLRRTAQQIRLVESEQLARALNIPPHEMADVMEGLADILESGGSDTELLERVKSWEAEVDNLDRYAPDSGIGLTVRGAGALFAALTAAGSWRDLPNDPTASAILTALVDGGNVAQSSAELLTAVRTLDDAHWISRLGSNDPLSKALGVVGLSLSVPGILDEYQSGDFVAGSLDAISFGGALASILKPKTPLAFGRTLGPVGAGVSTLAALGSLGWDQYSRVRESNKYTGSEARDFLAFSDLDADAVRSLVDRSGEGYSPVPILMEYARQHGLSAEQAITWLNSLEKGDLDLMRDIFHITLDDIDGETAQFLTYSTSDDERIAEFQSRIEQEPHAAHIPALLGGPENRNLADWLLEFHGIPRPIATS